MESYSPEAVLAPLRAAAEDGARLRVLGADGSLRARMLAALARTDGSIFAVTRGESEARELACDVAFFLGLRAPTAGSVDGPVLVVPELDASPFGEGVPDARAVASRFAALARLGGPEPPRVTIASLAALSRRVIPMAALAGLRQRWNRGEEVGHAAAIATFERIGFARADVVEDPGTYAVRGGVIDVFVPSLANPVRIEWFGDEIERMRTFDPETQRSEREIASIEVFPVRDTVPTIATPLRTRVLELAETVAVPTSRVKQVIDALEAGHDFFGIDALAPLFHERMVPLWEHVPAGTHVVVDDPRALAKAAEELDAELSEEHAKAIADKRLVPLPVALTVGADELESFVARSWLLFDWLDPPEGDGRRAIRILHDRDERMLAELETARARKSGELLRPVVDKLKSLALEVPPWAAVVASPNTSHAERMVALLRDHGLDVDPPRPVGDVVELLSAPRSGTTRVRVVAGELSTGWASAIDRVFLLAEADIFGPMARRAKPRKRRGGVGGLGQLAVGDYVVHVVHGVGRYAGLVALQLGGIGQDYVLVEYSGTDRLYLPVTRLNEIERYVSAEAKPPRLDKMGGTTFATKSARVKAEVRQIAEELLQIYAQREALDGHAHADGGEPMREFEATFPFEETVDQEEAIAAVQRDLGRAQPMDRLICGDVGFGKTEVALRAAFRVAHGGKQVAVLAPTTVLVQQHYHTFRDRMEPFGLKVGVLNRFTEAKQRAATLAGIRDGSVDVVVGTHRILSTDVRFDDLGLVVIDEEQRFGVTQKERFKRLKTEVDVLSMSATPIPRTLHMSLLGIREISLVMTPPGDRLAVRTFVTRPSDSVLQTGIEKELARGGQVFYVVPRILGIEEHAARLRKLVPEARIRVAHGQMPGEMLEETMLAFVEHEIDILVSTTIIESGLDIPRANTMFVADADHFGLGQLYQLRGRIGRSKHRAFCYLLVESLEKLQPDARRRLEAIAKFSELGSGFAIASHDLEIRGAGEILGARQSGNIQAIGFEAYSRILTEAVAELRGQPILRESDPELAFDVPAFLPESYVEDTGTRLDFYRRLSVAHDRDTVAAIMDEVRDRFGEPPAEARNLEHVMAAKTYGRRLHASALELRGERFGVRLSPQTTLPPAYATALHGRTGGRIRLAAPDRIAAKIEGSGDELRLRRCVEVLAELVTALPAA